MAGLTVAVTGATGEIGKPFVRALERSREVGRIVGMARRPLHPAALAWRRAEYRRGDVLDRAAVERLVDGADVVVHLAFVILEAGEQTRDINVEGSRNVFEAAARAGVRRLVHVSSVAAYGFPGQVDTRITEDFPAVGEERHPYSAHKAEVEAILHEVLAGRHSEVYVFRPSSVAGPEAPRFVGGLPYVRWAHRLPPVARPLVILPDPGVPLQLVHHDDVATALRAAVLGRGEPGAYNLAAPGEITIRDLGEAMGVRTVPLPRAALDAASAVVARVPFLPAQATWIEALRRPALMDTAKARQVLRWRPRFDARETLRQTVAALRG